MKKMYRCFFYTWIICIFILFTAVIPCAGEEKQKITVFDLNAINLPASYLPKIRSSIEYNLYKNGDFQLLERHEVEMIFNELRIKQNECKQTSCIVEVGKTLSADFALSGTINKQENDQYELVLKLIAIKNAEIASIYTRTFNSYNEIDEMIKTIIDKVTEDIHYYLENGAVKRPEKPSLFSLPDYNISVNALYFKPFNKFENFIEPGFGAVLQADVRNIFLKDFSLGIFTGFVKSDGKVNSIDYSFLVPFELSAKYRFNIFNKLELLPVISSGTEMIYLKQGEKYDKQTKENFSEIYFYYAAETGFDINYKLFKPFAVTLGSRFGMLLYNNGNYKFVNIMAGIQYFF